MIKKIMIAICLVVLVVVATFCYLSPIFNKFPKPTGEYAVGTTVIELTDNARQETYSENLEEKRSVVVRFFYPIDKTTSLEKYSYLGAKMPYFQQYIASTYHLPLMVSKLLLRNIYTHSFINAPVATKQNRYPVVLFSHGLLGFPSDTYLAILENIASQGYIVVAIDHPYFNGLTLYANGKVVTEKKLNSQFSNMSQKEQKEFLSEAIQVYKGDQKFVVDELYKLNEDPNSIFYHRINLEQIAAMGNSAGGTSSIEFCRIDYRCKAAIDLDGWYDHVIGQEPINKPLLLLFGSKSIEVTEPTPQYLKKKELTREQYFEREKNIADHKNKLCSAPNCSMVIIQDVSHGDFGDDIFTKWPFRSWSAVNAYQTTDTINKNIIDFLNKYLVKGH